MLICGAEKPRSGRQGIPCRPVCEKKLYEKHLL